MFKIDQIAITHPDPESVIEALSALGFDEWSRDTVTATGKVFDFPEIDNIKANLYFNYQLIPGIEFEILHYLNEPNWVELNGQKYGMTHMGFHTDDMDKVKAIMKKAGHTIAQEVKTTCHTNPAIKDTRRYHYVIFNTRFHLGFDLKAIQRLEINHDD